MRTIVLALLLASTGVLGGQTRDGLTSGSRTLQDVARERRLGIRPAAPGSFSVTGAAGMPVLLAPVADSFAEVDRADTAHQPAPPTYADLPVYDPYFVTYGGGWNNWQHRHASHSAHVAPVRPAPPVVARPPAPPRPVQHSSSGMTGRSGSGRGKR